jgi:hypothetical protein
MFMHTYGLVQSETGKKANYNSLFGFGAQSEERVDPHTHIQQVAPTVDLARVAELVRPKYLGPEYLSGEYKTNELQRAD